MPAEGGEFTPVSSLLTFEQIERFVRMAVDLGFRKLRLTGGEPLLRPKLSRLIERLAAIPHLEDIALTTNAVLLGKMAEYLHGAGLRRLNIHLDTLDRARFRTITRRDDLPRVLDGIEAARQTGFRSIKLNAVALKGTSEPDIVALTRFARERNTSNCSMQVRFIEFMPLDGQNLWSLDRVLTTSEMIEILTREFGPLTPVPDRDLRAPATEYEFADGSRVGFIASVTRPFCLNCNRLRLTADGKLRNCLFARDETDVSRLLQHSGTDEALEAAIRRAVWAKWAGHGMEQTSFQAPQRPMYSIGG